MRRFATTLLAAALIVTMAGCQITLEDLTPFEFRQVTGPDKPPPDRPPPDKPPDQPPVTGKDIVYILGVDGVD